MRYPEFLFDFPNQDIACDSYLFVRGLNMNKSQRTRAMMAIRNGNLKQMAAKSVSTGIRYHKIRKGDTLGRISRRYHVSIDRLCKINGIRRTTTLRPGQILRCS